MKDPTRPHSKNTISISSTSGGNNLSFTDAVFVPWAYQVRLTIIRLLMYVYLADNYYIYFYINYYYYDVSIPNYNAVNIIFLINNYYANLLFNMIL